MHQSIPALPPPGGGGGGNSGAFAHVASPGVGHSQFIAAGPCIRLERGKFESTNQDSAGGKNSSVLK